MEAARAVTGSEVGGGVGFEFEVEVEVEDGDFVVAAWFDGVWLTWR